MFFKYFAPFVLILCAVSAPLRAQEQSKGTDLSPWVQEVLQPLLQQDLQGSFTLIYDQGMALTYVADKTLIFSSEANMSTQEERNSPFHMTVRNPFTITVLACPKPSIITESDMWDSKISQVSLRAKRTTVTELNESIRELTLLTNTELTSVNGIADTFASNGDRATRIQWVDEDNNRHFSLISWLNSNDLSVWVTFHLQATDACE